MEDEEVQVSDCGLKAEQILKMNLLNGFPERYLKIIERFRKGD